MTDNTDMLDNCGIEFIYKFSSGLGCYEHARFVREVVLEILLTGGDDNVKEKIGQVSFLIVYINQAYESRLSLYEILDAHSEYLARHIFNIINYKTGWFTEKLQKFYGYEIEGSNVCLIENINISAKYRGQQIGAKAIKDIIFHYASGCGLFALQPFPLQFEAASSDEKYAHLDLDCFEQDQKKASKKLESFYQNIGFDKVKGIKDLLFLNPSLKNHKLEMIDLEESPFD